ncbi:MAG TPA: ABC transporter permease, partial [Methylomirabilota bacterium]|nr:ABC transporter permease [Methylomirabilota bacterium]
MSLGTAALPAGAAARPPRRLPWAPLIPALAFLAVVFAYPVLQLLWLSVVDRSGALTGAHYARLLATPVYWQVLLITFRIAAWSTALSIAGGYPVAYLLATAGGRWRGALTLCVLLPFWTSFLVRTFAWIVLLGRNGAVNKL